MSRSPSSEEIDEFVRLYVQENMTILDISFETGRSLATIGKYLDMRGVQKRPQYGTNNRLTGNKAVDGIKGTSAAKIPRVKLGNSKRGHRRRGSL